MYILTSNLLAGFPLLLLLLADALAGGLPPFRSMFRLRVKEGGSATGSSSSPSAPSFSAEKSLVFPARSSNSSGVSAAAAVCGGGDIYIIH